jgi:hypothetical protein
MVALTMLCECDEVAGVGGGAGMECEWKGGRGVMATSKGGGGRLWLSPAVGELVLFRTSEPRDGEKTDRIRLLEVGHV